MLGLLIPTVVVIAASPHSSDLLPNLRYGWTLPTYFYSLQADQAGNVLIAGPLEGGPIDVDPTNGVDMRSSLSSGAADILVTKLNADGSYGWTYVVGSKDDESGIAVAADEMGNVFATGIVAGPVDFDPGPGEDVHFTTNGQIVADGETVFITNLAPNGDYRWTRSFEGEISAYPAAIVVAPDRAVILSGSFAGPWIDFDPGPGVELRQSLGNRDIFVTKLTTDGDHVWTRTFGGPSLDYGGAVAVDRLGNIFVTGTFRVYADFDPGPDEDLRDVGRPYPAEDVFVSKFGPDGPYGWMRTFPVYTSGTIAATADGGVVIGGSFGNALDFDPGPGVDWRPLAIGSGDSNPGDAFILKLDADGSYAWVYTIGSGGGWDAVADVDVDPISGDVLAVGFFKGSIDFDPGSGTATYPATETSPSHFLLRLSPSGAFVSTLVTPESNTSLVAFPLAVDGGGNVYFARSFNREATFDLDPTCGVDLRTGRDTLHATKLFRSGSDGDFDLDSDVDLYDVAQFHNCFAGVQDTCAQGASLSAGACDGCIPGCLPCGGDCGDGCDPSCYLCRDTCFLCTEMCPDCPPDCSDCWVEFCRNCDGCSTDCMPCTPCIEGCPDCTQCPIECQPCVTCGPGCDAFNFDAATIPAPPGSTPSIALADYAQLLPRLTGPRQ